MPKQRPPFDTQRYESRKAQGLSQRAIAQEMGMPEATLRKNLKVMAQGVAQAVEEGLPWGDQGMPGRADADVSPRSTLRYPIEAPLRETWVYLHSISTKVYLMMARKVLYVGKVSLRSTKVSLPSL